MIPVRNDIDLHSSSSSSAFPSFVSGLHHFGWDFCVCDRFLIQSLRLSHSIFVDDACWVCFFPAFTGLEHECQESMQWYVCVHRLDLKVYSHPKELRGNRIRTHVNSKGKYPLYWKNPQRRIEPSTLHQAGQRAQHTTYELFKPPDLHSRPQGFEKVKTSSPIILQNFQLIWEQLVCCCDLLVW